MWLTVTWILRVSSQVLQLYNTWSFTTLLKISQFVEYSRHQYRPFTVIVLMIYHRAFNPHSKALPGRHTSVCGRLTCVDVSNLFRNKSWHSTRNRDSNYLRRTFASRGDKNVFNTIQINVQGPKHYNGRWSDKCRWDLQF